MLEGESSAEAAARLVASLEELLAVFEAQGVQLNAARQRAESVKARFDEMIQARLAGEPVQPLSSGFLSDGGYESVVEDGRESARLSLRWETGFCDAYDALMRLHTFPRVRHIASRVARSIRALRMLQVEDLADERREAALRSATESVPPPPDFGSLDEDERRRARLEWGQKMVASMGRQSETVQDRYEEQISETQRLLETALRQARELAAEAGPID